MDREIIYWRHRTPPGVKVEEIFSGTGGRTPRLWGILARQVYNENAADQGYRNIEHFADGAPYLPGSDTRISVSHTLGMLVVATLPRTPEVDMASFSPRAAMGIDTETLDRVVRADLLPRFLNDSELAMVGDDPRRALLAWTAKEALYKAARREGLDWRTDMVIEALPEAEVPAEGRQPVYGRAVANGEQYLLYSWLSGADDTHPDPTHLITMAVGAHCATFKKTADRNRPERPTP